MVERIIKLKKLYYCLYFLKQINDIEKILVLLKSSIKLFRNDIIKF